MLTTNLTSSARDPAGGDRAPGVVQDVPVGVEEVVVGAGERARGASLNGLVPLRARGEVQIPARGNLTFRVKFPYYSTLIRCMNSSHEKHV